MEQEIEQEGFVTPFGRVLGVFDGVEGRSNGNDEHFSGQQNFHNGFLTGFKYQCVEYARRWVIHKGFDFWSVPFAAHIWKIKYLHRLSDNKITSFTAMSNGSPTPPVANSIIIWKVAEQVPYGHIAVITEVSIENRYVRIAEQNVDNDYWPGNYARELKLDIENGGYFIRDEHEMYGWMVINFDIDNLDQAQFEVLNHPIARHEISNYSNAWLDFTDPVDLRFSEVWGPRYAAVIPFYSIEAFLAYKIKYATMEVMFLSCRATGTVIESDELMERFNVPKWAWPIIRKSWAGFQYDFTQTLSGRIEFGINGKSLKMLRYAADSFNGLCESAYFDEKLSGKYLNDAEKFTSHTLYAAMVTQCKKSFNGLVHVFIEDDAIEEYSALFVQKMLKDSGIESKVIKGSAFNKNAQGKFEDLEGAEIKTVWKLCDWQKVFKDYERPRAEGEVKMSDLLINEEVQVFEPIWKAVTANCGLLVVLHELFPDHNYLLDAEWTPSEGLKEKGYKIMKTDEGYDAGTFYVEDFVCQKYEEHSIVAHSWPTGLTLSGFSIVETNTGMPLACAKIINDD